MKIALFTDTFLPDVNGVARTLGRWTKYLENHGESCMVFAPDSNDEGSRNYADTMVERFTSIPFLLYPECKLAIPNPIQLNRKLHAYKPDIIHVATPFNLGLYGLYYARKHKIPAVASYHTHFDRYLAYYNIQWMESMLWKYLTWFHQPFERIYVPSPSTQKHLEHRGFEHLEVWSRGVDISRFHPDVNRTEVLSAYGLNPARFTLLYVGRLAPEKSIDVLLKAYSMLPERIARQAQLAVVGDGPLLHSFTECYKGRSDIIFPGYAVGEKLRELYAAADLFVFPSATETFGNVALEAMACGTAAVCAAAGGVMDTIAHGQNGWLCQPGDAADFAQAIAALFDEPQLRSRLAENGRKYSLSQSWDEVFARLLESYEQVARQRPNMSNQGLAAAK